MIPLNLARDPFVLSIDVGSSSVRTVILDREARGIEGTDHKNSLRMHTEPDGTAIMDPDLLKQAVYKNIDSSLESIPGEAAKIAGVGMCTFVSNLIGLDSHGNAITRVITYADSRAHNDADQLRLSLDEVETHQRTGCRFHTSYWTARLHLLKRTQPELFDSIVHWVSFGDYLYQELFGDIATSYSVASWTGLLDRKQLTWDEKLTNALHVDRSRLPTLVDSDHAFRGLRNEFAQRWPELSQASWYPAVGDGATANIGSGCVQPGKIALTMGTSAAVRVMLPGDVGSIPEGLWCYKVDANHDLLGGALSEGGNVYAWLNRVFNLNNVSLQEYLSTHEPDGHGLTFIPLLAGERAPGWNGSARGTLHGLSLATEPADIFVAGLEGVAYRIGLVYHLLEPHLVKDVEIIANGGALINSPEWLQIIADVLGKNVTLSGIAEASSRGAGMIVLKNIGIVRSLADLPIPSGRVFKPQPERYTHYQQAIKRQQVLYQQVMNK